MTPKEAIERLKHWPEMTELEKLHWLRVAVGASGKDSLAVIRLLLDHGFEVLPYHLYFRHALRRELPQVPWRE